MIKTNSAQLNAAIIFPKTFLERANFCLLMFFVSFSILLPGFEIADFLYDQHETNEHHIAITILSFSMFFQAIREIALKYTNVKPQLEDFFRVLGGQQVVYPTGAYGKMMLGSSSVSLFCSCGQLVWLIYAIWGGAVQAGFAIGFLLWTLSYLLNALLELGWLGKYPPRLT